MDERIFFWINGHHSALCDLIFWSLSAAADLYLIWWLAGIIARLADRKNGRLVFLGIVLSLVLAYIAVDLVIKPLAARPRPFIALEGVRCLEQSWAGRLVRSPFSFPSGHCASSAAAAWILGGAYPALRVPLALLVGLIAYSRVYLGMHYPGDCVAGVLIGILCAIAARRVTRRATGRG